MENPLHASNIYLYVLNRVAILLFGLGLACLACAENLSAPTEALTPVETPTPFESIYTGKLYGMTIDVTSRLTKMESGTYQIQFDVDSFFGKITEISQFSWNAQGAYIMPALYHYKRTGLNKNREQNLVFDWAKNEVPSKKIQDKLSYQLQLRQDLMADRKVLTYVISDGGKLREYTFTRAGEEILDTLLGKVATIKVQRVQAKDKREIFAWFAKDFQHLLVQLQQEENGSAYTIYISKASLNGKAIEHF
jgi:hypothetical protein